MIRERPKATGEPNDISAELILGTGFPHLRKFSGASAKSLDIIEREVYTLCNVAKRFFSGCTKKKAFHKRRLHLITEFGRE